MILKVRGHETPTRIQKVVSDVRDPLEGYEPYYLGRTCTQLKEGRTWRGRRVDNEYKNHETQLPGKIHLSHNCLYVGFDEKEYIFKEYVFPYTTKVYRDF